MGGSREVKESRSRIRIPRIDGGLTPIDGRSQYCLALLFLDFGP